MSADRILFVTRFDPDDVRAWSGIVSFTRAALEPHFSEVRPFGNLRLQPAAVSRAMELWHRRVRHQEYDRARSVWSAKTMAAQIDDEVSRRPVDAIFSPSTIPVAFCRTDAPIFTYSDATFRGMMGYYDRFDSFCPATRRDADDIDRVALSKVAGAIYASHWAADSAVRDYGADPSRVHVVPFGANLHDPPAKAEALRHVGERRRDELRLLFLGVEWQRKGGDVALAATHLLRERGVPAHLYIVGCRVPEGVDLGQAATDVGFLNKKDPEQRAKLEGFLRESHFLLLPTRAECFGIVFAEAAANAMPSITYATGGVPDAVRDGVGGYALPEGASPEQFADRIEEVWESPAGYEALCRTARDEFDERLNWAASSARIAEIIRGH